MSAGWTIQPIVVYVVERHPLDRSRAGPLFRWLPREREDGFRQQLEALIGRYDPADVCVLVDREPGGSAWTALLQALIGEKVQMVVTHLAPLSPAQRQQLIGLSAECGAQLITPSDAGRNLPNQARRRSL